MADQSLNQGTETLQENTLVGPIKIDLNDLVPKIGRTKEPINYSDESVCRVEEIYLVNGSSGCLIAHWQRPDLTRGFDSDIVAGMLTSMQTFMHEAFNLEKKEKIGFIHMGKIRMMLQHSSHLYAAIIYKGSDSESLRGMVNELLNDIESRTENASCFQGIVINTRNTQALLDKFATVF